MPRLPDRRVIIIGGSMAGLFCGLLLLRRGWDVHVFERARDELSGRGAGIVTHPELHAIMAEAGIAPGDDLGLGVARRITLDRDGRVVGAHPFPQIVTAWDRLFRMLRDVFPDARYHPGRDLVRLAVRADGVTAHFAEGAPAEGALLIGADGIRSAVRGEMLPDARPLYAGYAAWRGLVDEAACPPDAHRALFDEFAFCLPPGEEMVGYPVAGPENDLRPGHRRYNFVWYRPADDLAALLTDESGQAHTLSIPPPLIRKSLVARMRQDAHRILAPAFAAMVDATPLPFLQPIYDLAAPALVIGRVALAGDAGFVARPHVGAGVTKAAQDALALAEALDAHDDLDAALRAYEATRLPPNRAIVRRARDLGAFLQARCDTEEERRAATRHGVAQAVMAEAANLDFLHEARAAG